MNTSQDNWEQCPPGEIQQMVGSLRARRGRRSLVVAASGLVCLSIVVGVISLLGNPGDLQAEQISCPDCQELLPQYIEGTLVVETSKKIDRHLKSCPHCQEVYQQHLGQKKPEALAVTPDATLAYISLLH